MPSKPRPDRPVAIASGAVLAWALWFPAPSDACSVAAAPAHEVDPSEVARDDTPPDPPTGLTVVTIDRGRGATCDADGVCMSTSCDDLGIVALEWRPGSDDRTPADQLGVVIRVAGDEDFWFAERGEAVRPYSAGAHSLIWVDGASDEQEPLDLVLEVSHIDLAGNESEPVTVRVVHEGSMSPPDKSGCATVTAGASVLLTLLGGLPVFLRRTRRFGPLR